ncbi:hypothetical protein MJO29_004570 [Puccinia striiformis f. sp. tritici]|nr:hypothetical protein MJO29_004570 [Puccinia striiformis f. sp. tritici]
MANWSMLHLVAGVERTSATKLQAFPRSISPEPAQVTDMSFNMWMALSAQLMLSVLIAVLAMLVFLTQKMSRLEAQVQVLASQRRRT